MEQRETTQLLNEKDWDPQMSYEKLNHIINGWPNWKKEVYNKMVAISAHAEKISINIK